jgi:hypothetical protein
MRIYKSYTPQNWEFGFGFYKSAWFFSEYTGNKTIMPSEFALLLGPLSVCIEFGKHIEVIE